VSNTNNITLSTTTIHFTKNYGIRKSKIMRQAIHEAHMEEIRVTHKISV